MKPFNLPISDSGELLGGIPHDRETIYIGRNGNAVERVSVNKSNSTSSYIFKPLTNYSSIGREVWVQQHIAPRIPEVRAPYIHRSSPTENPLQYWIIYEDMGLLTHSFGIDMIKEAAAAMPHWHLLSTDLVPDEFVGHTPLVNNIQADLLSKTALIREFLNSNGFNQADFDYIHREILLQPNLAGEIVICHGDFYPLNIAHVNNELVILDWEYIHKNSVFWDLYCLMDITSPMYRRPVLQQASRVRILENYILARHRLHGSTKPNFIQNYYAYCMLYSLWLLLLIEQDLTQDKFEKKALLEQRAETLEIFRLVCNDLMNS
jgi:hypothetical protein